LDKPYDSSFGRYSDYHLVDNNMTTAWVEGKNDDGRGEYVCIAIGNQPMKYISIANGFQKSPDLFQKNNRIKTIKATLYLAITDASMETQVGFTADAFAFPETMSIFLEDKEGQQYIPIQTDPGRLRAFRNQKLKEYILSHYSRLSKDKTYSSLEDSYFIKFEITEVYKGSKWDDTCLSEIGFHNSESPGQIPYNEKITQVYEDESSGDIRVNTSSQNYVLAGHDATALKEGYCKDESDNFVLGILDESPDHEWVIISEMYGGAGMRTQEINKLYSVRFLQPLNYTNFLADSYHHLGDCLGFSSNNGKTQIDFMEREILSENFFVDMLNSIRINLNEDGVEALALLFADAVKRHDVQTILSFMDHDYLHDQMNFLKGDSLQFINDQFFGENKNTNKFANIPLTMIKIVGEPIVNPGDNSPELILEVSDGEKIIVCHWVIHKSTSHRGRIVLGLVGASG